MLNDKRTVRLKRSDYQPSKAELEEDVSLDLEAPDATLEEQMNAVADALMTPVEIEHDEE